MCDLRNYAVIKHCKIMKMTIITLSCMIIKMAPLWWLWNQRRTHANHCFASNFSHEGTPLSSGDQLCRSYFAGKNWHNKLDNIFPVFTFLAWFMTLPTFPACNHNPFLEWMWLSTRKSSTVGIKSCNSFMNNHCKALKKKILCFVEHDYKVGNLITLLPHQSAPWWLCYQRTIQHEQEPASKFSHQETPQFSVRSTLWQHVSHAKTWK